MESQLQCSIDNLGKIFNDRMVKFEAELQQSVPSNIASLSAEFSVFRGFVKEAMECLQKQVELLAQSVDQLDMQNRRKIILLHGVPESKNEELAHVVADIVKNKMKIDGFAAHDIKRCHRMGRPLAPNKHRPILLKLQHLSVRDKIWFAKTKLKGSGVTASEFLTKPRHTMFMTVREKLGVNRCWTRGGHVYVLNTDGNRQRVDSLDILEKLLLQNADQNKNLEQRARDQIRSAKPKRNATQKK